MICVLPVFVLHGMHRRDYFPQRGMTLQQTMKQWLIPALISVLVIAGIGIFKYTKTVAPALEKSAGTGPGERPLQPDPSFGDKETVTRDAEVREPRPIPENAGNDLVQDRDEQEDAGDDLKIMPRFLAAAKQAAEEMTTNFNARMSILENPDYFNQSADTTIPALNLSLRLMLDDETAGIVSEILSNHSRRIIEQRVDMARSDMERTAGLLETDRTRYENYLAIQIMISQGVPVTEQQETYFNQYQEIISPEGASANAVSVMEWYEDSEVLAAVNEHLSTDQQAGLADFVREKLQIEQEQQQVQAYMRANRIADALGWSGDERDEVYAYLVENPDVTNEELLTPEQSADVAQRQVRGNQDESQVQAYMRSNRIANDLGLNKDERDIMYAYLIENPDVSDDELFASE